ncbi:MAG: glycosyltransferase [Candidatus Aegiribacteria sp.]|nr:glycosyltransferase [Candidatus Aegiribacteria sp.]
MIIPCSIVFVMLGKKDFHSGGYDFNFRMVNSLRSQGNNIEIIHFTTVPKGLPRKWFRASRYIYGKIRSSKPDLVIVSKSYQYVSLIRLMTVFAKTPVLYLIHHFDWTNIRNKLKVFMYRMYVRWLLGMAERVWVNSRNTREDVERMGIHPEIIRVINPGFEKDRRQLPNRSDRRGPVRFLCVGSLSPRKAQHVAVKACSFLDAGSYKMEFIGNTEGDIGYTSTVKKSISDEALSESIRMFGYIDENEVVDAYLRADVLVHAANWEGFGMSIIEGMWYGLPVIASDIAAIPELVRDGENGLLTPSGNAEELADAMNKLIRNRDLRLLMGEKSRMFAESMNDWNDTGKEFMELVMTAARSGRSE